MVDIEAEEKTVWKRNSKKVKNSRTIRKLVLLWLILNMQLLLSSLVAWLVVCTCSLHFIFSMEIYLVFVFAVS